MIKIDVQNESKRITSFLKWTFKDQNINHAVIGISGGVDSATSLLLLTKTLSPSNIHTLYLPYFSDVIPQSIQKLLDKAQIPQENRLTISIKNSVDVLNKQLGAESSKIRLGNLIARTRMIILFDFAKKQNAMVCGTENRSEHLLGYFTRFGDEASDIEPFQHLYKTQVIELAKYLGTPQDVIDQKPTAGLWEGQTDEDQFGFSYKEADEVLSAYFDEKKPLELIIKSHPHAEKIIEWVEHNAFKRKVPYLISKPK